MVLNSRNNDGFCLFGSTVSDFTSTSTAARRDFITGYIKVVLQAGIKVGLYYSLVDWRYRHARNHRQYP